MGHGHNLGGEYTFVFEYSRTDVSSQIPTGREGRSDSSYFYHPRRILGNYTAVSACAMLSPRIFDQVIDLLCYQARPLE